MTVRSQIENRCATSRLEWPAAISVTMSSSRRCESIIFRGERVFTSKRSAKCFQKNGHAAVLEAVLTIHSPPNGLPPHWWIRRFEKDALSAKTEGFHNRIFVDRCKHHYSPRWGLTSSIRIQRRRLLVQPKINQENVWPQLPHDCVSRRSIRRFSDNLNVAPPLQYLPQSVAKA